MENLFEKNNSICLCASCGRPIEWFKDVLGMSVALDLGAPVWRLETNSQGNTVIRKTEDAKPSHYPICERLVRKRRRATA